MGYFSGSIYSPALGMDTNLGVILPQDSRSYSDTQAHKSKGSPSPLPKTLILLHGLSDNGSAWPHRTALLRYAENYGIAVLLPEAHKSFYQNMVYGPQYFTYITEELPALAARMFQLDTSPGGLMIAGLSMGGYGALLAGLTYPERYCAVGSFSGACDARRFLTMPLESPESIISLEFGCERKAILGENLLLPDTSDLLLLAEQASNKKPLPRLYLSCGKQDVLLPENQAITSHLKQLDIPHHYEEWDGGHEWTFWDASIQKMLAHFLA